MCDPVLAFGQRGSHFFQCPSRRCYASLPKKLLRLVDAQDTSWVWYLALGAEDSFIVAYRSRDGKDHVVCDGLQAPLSEFLCERDSLGRYRRDIRNIQVSLGPYNESWYATDGASYLWMNLPAQLVSAFHARMRKGAWKDKPRIVALGANENFVLVTEDCSIISSLGSYRVLGKTLEYTKTQERGLERMGGVTLHPYRFDSFVARFIDGTLIGNNLPLHSQRDVDAMRIPLKQDTERLTKKRSVQRMDGPNQHNTLRREWSNEIQQTVNDAKAYKMALKLTLNISTGSIARLFG